MKNKRLQKGLLFSFLLTFAFASPLRVTAAEEQITKKLIITAKDEQDYKKQAENAFALKIEENGQKYERSEIRYEITDTTYMDKKYKSVQTNEPTQTITEDGIEYTLMDYYAPKTIDQTVTAYDDYDHHVTAADVPGTKDIVVTDEVTGEQMTVTCSLTGVAPAGTTTVDNVMTITFSNYNAAYYEWNGNYIAHNNQTPQLEGYEDQLLAQVGAAPGSVITGYHYAGDPYTVDGVVYRDATATVRQQVPVYRANYEGIFTTQDSNASGTATYSGLNPEGRVELTVVATAIYESIPMPIYNVVITAIIVIALLAVVFFLFYLFLKRKRKKERVV